MRSGNLLDQCTLECIMAVPSCSVEEVGYKGI